jgi:hypothetical protein
MPKYQDLIEKLKEKLEKTQYNNDVKKIDNLLIEAVKYADENIITSSKEKILLRFIFFRVKCPFSFLFSNKQVILRKLAPFTKKLNSDPKIMDAHENTYEKMYSVDIFFKNKENNEHNPYMDAEILKFTSFEKCLSEGSEGAERADSRIGCYNNNPGVDIPKFFSVDPNNEAKVDFNFYNYNFMKKYPEFTGKFFPVIKKKNNYGNGGGVNFQGYIWKGPKNSLVCCECSDQTPENLKKIEKNEFPTATSVFANSEDEVKHAINSYKEFIKKEQYMIKSYTIIINSTAPYTPLSTGWPLPSQYSAISAILQNNAGAAILQNNAGKNNDEDEEIWKCDDCNDCYVIGSKKSKKYNGNFSRILVTIIAANILDVEYLAKKYSDYIKGKPEVEPELL